MNQLKNKFMLSLYNQKDIKEVMVPAVVWFILIAIVAYAFYCTSRGYNFGVISNPFKLGCYIR